MQGAGGVHSACWGRLRVGGRAGGGLKQDVHQTTEEDRPPRLGGDVVTFKEMRDFPGTYSEYEQQMHVTDQDGRDRVLAKKLELVDSQNQMMAADELYDGEASIDLSEEELMRRLKTFAGALICRTRVTRILAARYSFC